MLAAAVDARKGLFMEQAHQTVAGGYLFQQFHGQLVFVTGAVGIGVDGRDLVLGGSHLVVLRLGQHAQLPQLLIQLPHKRGYPGLDSAVIVVVQLLPLGGTGTEQRAAAQLQILALAVYLLVDQEVLLLRAYLRRDMLRLGVAEQPQDTDALPVQHTHRAQQRRFFVQRLPTVRAENGRDIQRLVLDESVGGGVPGGVAAGFKCSAQTAGGEGGGVRLALAQFLGAQLHDHAVFAVAGDEAVVFFGGNAGHRLEPVGVMGGTLLNGPILHGIGDLAGGGTIQRRSLGQALLPFLVGGGGETLLHLLLTKHHFAKQSGNVRGLFTHCGINPFKIKYAAAPREKQTVWETGLT